MKNIFVIAISTLLVGVASARDPRACHEAASEIVNDNKIELCLRFAQKNAVPVAPCVARMQAYGFAANMDLDAIKQQTVNHRHAAEAVCAR